MGHIFNRTNILFIKPLAFTLTHGIKEAVHEKQRVRKTNAPPTKLLIIPRLVYG
jgi:hypothetical protein